MNRLHGTRVRPKPSGGEPGEDPRTVQRWVKTFEQRGFDGLRDGERPGWTRCSGRRLEDDLRAAGRVRTRPSRVGSPSALSAAPPNWGACQRFADLGRSADATGFIHVAARSCCHFQRHEHPMRGVWDARNPPRLCGVSTSLLSEQVRVFNGRRLRGLGPEGSAPTPLDTPQEDRARATTRVTTRAWERLLQPLLAGPIATTVRVAVPSRPQYSPRTCAHRARLDRLTSRIGVWLRNTDLRFSTASTNVVRRR